MVINSLMTTLHLTDLKWLIKQAYNDVVLVVSSFLDRMQETISVPYSSLPNFSWLYLPDQPMILGLHLESYLMISRTLLTCRHSKMINWRRCSEEIPPEVVTRLPAGTVLPRTLRNMQIFRWFCLYVRGLLRKNAEFKENIEMKKHYWILPKKFIQHKLSCEFSLLKCHLSWVDFEIKLQGHTKYLHSIFCCWLM